MLLLATLLLFVGAAVAGPGSEGMAWLVVLVGLVVVAAAEGLAWFFGPVSWRLRLRRWGIFAATADKLAYAWSERVATVRGNRLLRDAALLGVKEEDLPDVRLYRPKGREPWAVVPPLAGLTEERLSTVMQAQAWRYAGVGATVAVEAVPILDQWVVRFSRVRVLPGLVPYPVSTRATVDRLPVGVDERGDEVSLRLRESNALVAGLPGSGKSGFVSALLASAVGCGPSVAIYAIDPKRVELAAWRPALVRIATEDADFLPLLNDLADEMDARYVYLEQNGLRKFERFDAARPLIVLVVDELAEVVATGDAEVHQVKEKFGSLRYYIGWPEGTPQDVKVQMRRVIRIAEEESSHTCERCGEPGVLRQRPGGVKTLCDACGAELGFEPVAVDEAGRAYVARLNERFRNPVYSGCTPINKDERRTRDA